MTFRARNNGSSLLEMLAYVVVSVVILNMAMVAFLRTGRIAAAASERVLHVHSERTFTSQFTKLTRSATEVVEQLGEYASTSSQVILKTPEGYIGVGMPGGTLAIWHLEPQENNYIIGRITTFPSSYASIIFSYDTIIPGDARCITAQLNPAEEDKQGAPRVITATLRASKS